MAECNCGTGSLPIIKQGDAYAVQVSLTFNGEPIVYSDLDLIEEIEFTFGELAPMRFKPKDIYNTTIGAFLVPLTQKQTFMLEDGKILVDCRVQFWGGDVVGVARMVRVFVREALSWEIFPEKPYHEITPSAPGDVLVLPLTVTSNGTYTAPSGSAYSPVVVNVPQGEGGDVTVEPLTITSNGTYTAPTGKAYSPVTVAVPQSGGGGDDHEDIPSYVKAEAQSVAARVAAKMQNDSIVFMVGSDSHQSTTEHVADGNLHGGMAMKALAYVLPLDFAAYLGDYTTGSSTTTIEEGLGHISQINADIADAFNGLPQFRTVGNHDPLGYSMEQNGTSLSQEQLYALIGIYNANAGNVMGSTVAGYCYRDFTSKRVRVICLNTADATNTKWGTEGMTAAQKTWFAQTMASTPSGYGLIILSHHPLDWGSVHDASDLVYAYINGSDYNAAYVLAFHGHVHCYKVDYLNHIVNNVGVPYTVKRIAVPNMCFGRNNEYGRNGQDEYYGIEFGETTTYNKTANSGDDTAFCVMVINPTEQKVHAICYGAGYDREVYFGAETVAVTGVTLNAASGTLAPGATTTLTATVAPANATNKTVLWTTSNSAVATVSGGTVTAVGYGTATITATTQDGGFTATYALTVASQHDYTNLVTLADNPDSNYSNGYRTGYRLNSSGTTSEQVGSTVSGFIPYTYTAGDVIRIGLSENLASYTGWYLGLYDANKEKLFVISGSNGVKSGDAVVYDLDTLVSAIQSHYASTAYIRFSVPGSHDVSPTGDLFVCTLNEEIE